MTIKKIRGKKFLLQEMVGGGWGWRSNSCLKNAPFQNLSQFWSKQEEMKIRTRIWESFNYSGFVKYLNKEDQAI